MHHLDEVSGAVRPAMCVALYGPRIAPLSAGCQGNVADPRRQGVEDRVEMIDDRLVAADHETVTAIKAPDAAAGADIHVEYALCLQRLGSADIVLEEAVAAIDD